MRNPELEQVILAAPDDPAGYLVYADWLQANGDPRGELIVRQHGDKDSQAWLDEHREAFLGRFASATPPTFELEWRFGFIRKATIGWEMFGGEDEDDTSAAQLEAFLRHDSARLIQELWLGPTAHDEELMMSELADAIDTVKPPALRVLYLGDTSDWDISSTYTRMPVSASIPRMTTLMLRGGGVTLDEQIDLPRLTSFSVESGGLGSDALTAIASARWPELEQLEIWFGDPNYGASGTVEHIAPILAAQGLPKLRVLKLKNCPFADAIAERLATAKILPQLRELDLAMGNLSDRGVAAMLASTAAFKHLDKLDLSDNALTDASWPAARALANTVEFGTEHDPERAVPRPEGTSRYRRYVSVGE